MDNKMEKLEIDTTVYETGLTQKFLKRKPYIKNDPSKITAYIPGIIRKVFIYDGKRVKKGDKLLILEAMKMENTVCTSYDAVIKNLCINEGDVVIKNQVLVELELL